MRKFTLYPLVAAGFLALSACTSMTGEPPMKYTLKDGSILYVDKAGNMTMTDKYGKPLAMVDGEPMAMADGSILMMKNRVLYKRLGKGGK